MSRWFGFALVLHFIASLTHVFADFRHISYNDLAKKQEFQQEGVSSFSQLLFDVARQQVIVGARDNLYRLTLTTLTPIEHAAWPAAKDKTTSCQDKGQSVEDCHNYIKVLLSNGKSLFTCGTNAFSPRCSWREIENINSVTSSMSGVAMCPYSPHSNVTALLARGQSGGLFAGTPTDFSGADTAIYRTLASPNLRTRQYDSKWLNDPQFVGSFETDDYVYFLFRESAVEYINCGKRIYSRIARVCKYDPGSPMLMKDTWTTFSKARLNCSLPGEFPFYYDEIQGAAYQPEEGLVYATFTTPSNAIAGSAICAFNMSAIAAAFDGPFKHQENSGAAWERKPVAHDQQKCGFASSTGSRYLTDNQRYQLMDEAVQSATPRPLHTATLERFTHLAVDVTPTKVHKGVAVLYVATTDGLIKKISVLPRTLETCIVEIWGPLPSTPITLQYLKETKSLYVGMQSALLRIPTVQCYRHRNPQSCLNAQEPYCGWDEHLMVCRPAPAQTPDGYLATHWQQDATKCPILTGPVNGGWSAWSTWHTCLHETSQSSNGHPSNSRSADDQSSDTCQCQTRECNNPPSQNGGTSCTGSRMRVANCTSHGGWTAWSAWSACSQSCGPAMKTRRRTCTNPTPQHGGRVCLGTDHEENFCIEQPPCPSPVKPSVIVPQWGAWSGWGPWNACSKPCGGGFKIRKRICESQSRHDGAVECPGCNFQIEECNSHACQETKKYFSSPWMAGGNGTSGSGRMERRYRFVCRAQTDDPSSVKVQAKEEERHCRSDGSCSRRSSSINIETSLESGWSDWSSWSPCSHSCGGGTQYKIKQCDSPSCEGPLTESRACNTKPCRGLIFQQGSPEPEPEGQWSCWSSWSECSVSCGFGVRTRGRECLGPGECLGPSRLRESCEMQSCEFFRGWDTWSAWGRCDEYNLQRRRRKCLVAQPGISDCLGPSEHARFCLEDTMENDVNALPSRIEMAGVSVGAVVGSCLVGFLIGLALTALMCFYYLKRQKPRIPGSPHYISKQNPYVTVPLKEVNTKRQPSFSGSTNGTLRTGKNNSIINGLGSPKLYPKALEYESATLKRNSREQHIRAELDQEKYY
ncbi:PREDICTED: semaphorin-5B [Ceratosolen solmsi marchali]|uniref:Semaphorin-5B n=1 Tax=Ceratosolen solmsi marchali TaxID=326594 RepID=A0AAJ7DV02_9HYME|nr:PREDICTED: semaphorin-5B [Ceratosolen solmsi marchali]